MFKINGPATTLYGKIDSCRKVLIAWVDKNENRINRICWLYWETYNATVACWWHCHLSDSCHRQHSDQWRHISHLPKWKGFCQGLWPANGLSWSWYYKTWRLSAWQSPQSEQSCQLCTQSVPSPGGISWALERYLEYLIIIWGWWGWGR